MTSIPPRDRALLDHADRIRSLVMDNHQLRCERDAAQRAQWHQQEEIERLRALLDKCQRKLGYLLRDYPGDKETAGILSEIAATQKDGGK